MRMRLCQIMKCVRCSEVMERFFRENGCDGGVGHKTVFAEDGSNRRLVATKCMLSLFICDDIRDPIQHRV